MDRNEHSPHKSTFQPTSIMVHVFKFDAEIQTQSLSKLWEMGKQCCTFLASISNGNGETRVCVTFVLYCRMLEPSRTVEGGSSNWSGCNREQQLKRTQLGSSSSAQRAVDTGQ